MAFEDLITRQTPSAITGLSSAVSQGFELAKAKQQIDLQREQVKIQQMKVSEDAMDAITRLIPSIKASKGAEKKFKINGMKKYAEVAGLALPDDFYEVLEKSEGTSTAMADLTAAARKYSDDPIMQMAFLTDGLIAAGKNPLEAKSIMEAMTQAVKSREAALVEQRKRDAAIKSSYDKAKVESRAPLQFIKDLEALTDKSLEEKNLVLSQRKSGLDQISDVQNKLIDPARIKNIPQSKLVAIQEIGRIAKEELDNPATVEAGLKKASDLQSLVIKEIGQAQAVTAEKEAKSEDLKEKIMVSGAVRSLAKDVRNNNKVLSEALDTSSRVMNILRDPEVSRTAIGADAIISLLARWIDPRTGVREGEQNRVATAAAGGDINKIKMLARKIYEGRTLDKEQRESIAKLVNLELKAARERYKMVRESMSEQAKALGADPEAVMKFAGFIDVPGELKGDAIPEDLFKKDEKSQSSWFDRLKSNLSVSVDSEGNKKDSALIKESGLNPALSPSFYSGQKLDGEKPAAPVAKKSVVSSLRGKLFSAPSGAGSTAPAGNNTPAQKKAAPDTLTGQEFLDYLMGN